MSATELINSLDDVIIDKVESLSEELDSLIELIYVFDEMNEKDAYKEISNMQLIIEDIYNIVDSMGFFQVTARSFANLNIFLSNLSIENLASIDKKKLFVQMFLSLIQDLEKWIQVIFVEVSTDDIHYFDASFSSNILEIENVFIEDSDDDDDDDDLEFF